MSKDFKRGLARGTSKAKDKAAKGICSVLGVKKAKGKKASDKLDYAMGKLKKHVASMKKDLKKTKKKLKAKAAS